MNAFRGSFKEPLNEHKCVKGPCPMSPLPDNHRPRFTAILPVRSSVNNLGIRDRTLSSLRLALPPPLKGGGSGIRATHVLKIHV